MSQSAADSQFSGIELETCSILPTCSAGENFAIAKIMQMVSWHGLLSKKGLSSAAIASFLEELSKTLIY